VTQEHARDLYCSLLDVARQREQPRVAIRCRSHERGIGLHKFPNTLHLAAEGGEGVIDSISSLLMKVRSRSLSKPALRFLLS
jgi:hypothetical protein